MYESKWAGIVYGRSYHLDFRLVAIPEDFTNDETNWALEYIIPTTRAASKLVHYPRWSLFKNRTHCIFGVTCMVRDLIGENNQEGAENLTKDAQGRPLYIFVGYSTKINPHKYILRFPTYQGTNLAIFRPLYQYIQDQWLVKDSDFHRKKTTITNYQRLSFKKVKPKTDTSAELVQQLNCQGKYPNKIFLWQNLAEWHSKLWATAAICKKPTSLCLGLDNYQNLLQSPFLNGTVANLTKSRLGLSSTDGLPSTEFIIQDRLTGSFGQLDESAKFANNTKFLLPLSLEAKVKKELQFTFQQAGQAVNFGQELIQKIIDRYLSANLEEVDLESIIKQETGTFGFKIKDSEPQPPSPEQSPPESRDWF